MRVLRALLLACCAAATARPGGPAASAARLRRRSVVGRGAAACLRLRGGSTPGGSWGAPTVETLPSGSSGTAYGSPTAGYALDGGPAEQQAQQQGTISPVASLADRHSRLGFVRKVYSTLGVQLLVTCAAVAYIGSSREAALFLMYSPLGKALTTVSMLVGMGMPIVLSLNERLRKTFPQNVLALGAFTFAEALLIGLVASAYSFKSVALGLFQTGTIVAGLTAYSFQPNPKYDLTASGQTLATIMLVFFMTMLANIFLRMPALDLLISGAGAALMSVFIVHDTQLIVGGKRQKFRLEKDEYIMGALALYIDIINLFMFLLRLFGDMRE